MKTYVVGTKSYTPADCGGYEYEGCPDGGDCSVSGSNASGCGWKPGDEVGRLNASCVEDMAFLELSAPFEEKKLASQLILPVFPYQCALALGMEDGSWKAGRQ